MSKKLRILHICSSLAWGGGEMSAINLAKNFQKRGHDILFALHPYGRMIKDLEPAGVTTIPVKLHRNFDPVSVYLLVKIMRSRKIDIIHVHLSRDLVHVYWALKFVSQKPPVILHKQVSSKVTKTDFFHRQIYSQVTKIFVLSNFLKENILETCPVRDDEVTVIPGGIDLHKYDVPTGIRDKIRREWNILPSAVVFGTIGRIDRGKGYLELIQAFSELVKNEIDTRLIIVGEPTAGETEFAGELNGLISELNLTGYVQFTGFRSDVAEILSAIDIFVLASYGEAFGYVLLEASASGLPIIATNAGGVPDIVVNGKTGLLIPPHDAESLRNAMRVLASDQTMRVNLGLEGRKIVEKNFVERDILDRIEHEYLLITGAEN